MSDVYGSHFQTSLCYGIQIMSTADQSQQLILLCHQMQKSGLQPSVGLLRSNAPFKVSVTDAINAIRLFNASSQQTEQPAEPNADDRVIKLEKRVAELEAAMVILEQRLANLDV